VNASKKANRTAIGGQQHPVNSQPGNQYLLSVNINTLWTGDADLRLYIITVQDG